MKKVLSVFLLLSVSIRLQAQCPPPTKFAAYNITSTSVDVDLAGSGNGPWEMEYGIGTFMAGTGTKVQIGASANTTTISGLLPSQSYRIYVKRICGSVKSLANTFTFTTSCNTAVSAPVNYAFEGNNWDTPSFASANGTMNSCWVVSPQGSHTFWSVGPPHETRLSTGPEGDHTSGFGQFICINGMDISSDSIATIKMPQIDLGLLAHPQLNLWYHLYGSSIDSLRLMARTPSDTHWSNLHTFIGEQQFSPSDQWQRLTLSLMAYAQDTVEIEFVGYGTGPKVRMSLDDISIQDSFSCQPPTRFRNVSNNDSSVLLNWDLGSSTNHQIEYGPTGFSIGNGIKILVNQHPFRISNLSKNSGYTFYIRDSCGPGQFSQWSRPLSVNTDCTPAQAPYFNDFEGSGWPLSGLKHCWNRYDYQDFKWNTGPPALSWTQSGPGANNHTPWGSKFIVANRPNQKGKARTSITSCLIDLDSIANPELVFWSHMFGLQISAFEISIDSGNGFELLRRIIGIQQIAKTDPWTEQIIALPAYGGKTVKVKFTGIASSNNSSLSRIAVDDFFIGEAPPCRKSTQLEVGNRSFTSAEISWLSGGAASWLVRYQATGGSQIINASSANPFSLTGLQSGTEYTVWVRDSCGLGDVGGWSAPTVFKTHCLPDTAPYFQDFEGSQFVVKTSYFNVGYLHPCWERNTEVGPMWQPSPATSFHNNRIPQNDHTTGNGKYIGGSIYLANGNSEPISFTSPHIDLSNLAIPELSFWYFLGGFTFFINQLRLEVNNGLGWQTLHTLNGPIQANASAPWQEQIVDLSKFANDTIRLRFTSLGDDVYSITAVGVDDISIHNSTFCFAPSNLVANYVSSNRALLSWSSLGASNWILKYQPDSGNFQYQATAVNDSFALTGLAPDTQYEIWVRDSCGSDVSAWHGPLFIRTDCLPMQVPFYESFDGADWTPSANGTGAGTINTCWRRPDTVYNLWTPKTGSSPSSLSGPGASRTGSGNYMMVDVLNTPMGSDSNIAELKTPFIINNGLQQPELSFWYHMYGQQIQNLKVYLEKGDASRIVIDSLIGQQQNSKNAQWQQRTLSLSAFLGDTLRIVFASKIGDSSSFVNAAVDDVEITDALCGGPSNLSATSITSNSADLNWMSVSAHSNLQFGPPGFSLGSGTIIFGTSSGHNLTGLQPFTTYNYYVQDSCNTLKSGWVGPFTFTTSCALPLATFSHQAPAQTVGFDASNSIGTALTYSWDFGDGNSGSGLNPTHSYAAPGTFTVSLVATDGCGVADTFSKSITACPDPLGVINYTRNGLTVNFDGTTSIGNANYYWNFGSSGFSSMGKPVITFPTMGSHNIYLVVGNGCGGVDTTFMTLVICDKPTALFTLNVVSTASTGMIVNFDGTGSGIVDSYKWDFGDGNTNTTSLKPSHTYSIPSLFYQVTLIVRRKCGLSDTISYKLNSVTLLEQQFSSFEVYPNPADLKVLVRIKENQPDLNFFWFDPAGKNIKVPMSTSTRNTSEFDVSALPEGQYLLLAITDKGSEYIKITVK